jgi:uncharacterized membrane protein YdjX (TVP38/TMEM64 family)
MRNKSNTKSLLKFILLICLAIVAVVFLVYNRSWIIKTASDPEQVRLSLLSYGNFGSLMYVIIQALHVLIVVIPGDLFNVCGGYIYGVPLGFLLSMSGIMLGSVLAFYISRNLGYDFLSRFIPQEKIMKISQSINSNQGMIGLFILCMIPLIPKDLMMYIAGLTPIKASKLFFIYFLSRIPGTLIWVSIGANAFERSGSGVLLTILGAAVLVCFVLFLQKTKHIEQN